MSAPVVDDVPDVPYEPVPASQVVEVAASSQAGLASFRKWWQR